jgi:hypothetical protein
MATSSRPSEPFLPPQFIEYYNRARPSQATHAIPDPYPELIDRPLAGGKLIALPVLGGVQHDYRLAA